MKKSLLSLTAGVSLSLSCVSIANAEDAAGALAKIIAAVDSGNYTCQDVQVLTDHFLEVACGTKCGSSAGDGLMRDCLKKIITNSSLSHCAEFIGKPADYSQGQLTELKGRVEAALQPTCDGLALAKVAIQARYGVNGATCFVNALNSMQKFQGCGIKK